MRAVGVTLCDSEDWQRVLPVKRTALLATREISNIEQTSWTAEVPQENQIYVALQPQDNGKLTAQIDMNQAESYGGMTLFLHDEVHAVWLNDVELEMLPTALGFEAAIPALITVKVSKLHFEVTPLPGGEACPIAFLRGSFIVTSEAPWIEKDEHQWLLEGSLELAPLPSMIHSENLISAGFPFAGSPIAVRKTIQLEAVDQAALGFTDLWADAALVKLNGHELGWCWDPIGLYRFRK